MDTTVATGKLERMRSGLKVITNETELDAMLASGDPSAYAVRSIPNPDRVGLLDQYVAWIEQHGSMDR